MMEELKWLVLAIAMMVVAIAMAARVWWLASILM